MYVVLLLFVITMRTHILQGTCGQNGHNTPQTYIPQEALYTYNYQNSEHKL